MANWYEVQRSKKGYRFLECTPPVQELKAECMRDASENAPAKFCAKKTKENVA